MKKTVPTVIFAAALFACSHSTTGTQQSSGADAEIDASPDAVVPVSCQLRKLSFTQAQGCGNDGSVEFCIPNDATAMAKVKQIATDANCFAGGGRAQCNLTPNQLLCFVPTTFPAHCVTQHGALSSQRWDTVCKLSSLPEIVQIVHTIFE
jgi:hypothetical protein